MGGEGERAARVKVINRQQLLLRPVDVDQLVGWDHPVRGIWELVGGLDLSRYYADIEAVEGVAGRSAYDPQLLISLWIYAYSQGVSSARQISRLTNYDPAYQWLTGMEGVNYHTLADFRVRHQEGLDELFVQVLGVLSAEGLVTLQRVMHDGTKVKACAGGDTFRREDRLRAHLDLARRQVEQMGDPRAEGSSRRQQKARQRAVREKQQRLQCALQELGKIRVGKTAEEAKQCRASGSDPQARIMKHGDGGYAPSYNVQISTDATAKVIVGVAVSQSASDYGLLEPAVQTIATNLGEFPQQVVVDGGFTCGQTIVQMQQKEIDLIGSLPEKRGEPIQGVADPAFRLEAFDYRAEENCFICPAGKTLAYRSKEKHRGGMRYRYQAAAADCQLCPFKPRCCPKAGQGRWLMHQVDDPAVVAFREKMQTSQAKEIYKQRGAVAEFPNLWIKTKIALRQFRVRGLHKVEIEARWACLTYNIQQWIRLCWRPRQAQLALG